jgi:hypothetical protein
MRWTWPPKEHKDSELDDLVNNGKLKEYSYVSLEDYEKLVLTLPCGTIISIDSEPGIECSSLSVRVS